MQQQKDHLSFEEARNIVQDMTLITDFFFNYLMEEKERAKEVAGIIISTVMGYKIEVNDVTAQKTIVGIDKGNHGIRLDVLVDANKRSSSPISASAFACDIEMENRKSDKKQLPRRQRFYSSLTDSKLFNDGTDYDALRDYFSITFLSYDPFGAGDMYYEAKAVLTSHPDIKYDDGRVNYFFYGGGKNNIPGDKSHGKSVAELVKYIVEGKLESDHASDLTRLDEIVNLVKKKPEVTRAYMKEWDRQRIHDKELTEQIHDENAIKFIIRSHQHGTSIETIKQEVKEDYGFSDEHIDQLIDKALAQPVASK